MIGRLIDLNALPNLLSERSKRTSAGINVKTIDGKVRNSLRDNVNVSKFLKFPVREQTKKTLNPQITENPVSFFFIPNPPEMLEIPLFDKYNARRFTNCMKEMSDQLIN